jgi:hypothetical protein
MKKLDPSELGQFSRKFTFAGGRVRRVVVRSGPTTAVELRLTVRAAVQSLGDKAKRVRLRLVFDGVEEYRFQKRPSARGGKIPDARFGTFDGLIYLNLDAYGLEPGERPTLPDFRASDAYVGGASVHWEELTASPGTPGTPPPR